MKLKTCLIFSRTVAFLAIALCWGLSFSQQLSPIEIISYPEKYDIFLSGTGGGDLNSLNLKSATPSAQGMVEAIFFNHTTKKGRYLNLPLIARWNFFPASKIIQRDSFAARSLAFVDNNQLFNLGVRLRNVGSGENDRLLLSPTIDFSYNAYSISDSSNIGKLNFQSINAIASFQLGLLKHNSIGNAGFLLSANGGFIGITEPAPNTFKEAVRASSPVSKNYFSCGGKIQVLVNDISVFFEIKRVQPFQNHSSIDGFSDSFIISFGGNALGSILKSGRK